MSKLRAGASHPYDRPREPYRAPSNVVDQNGISNLERATFGLHVVPGLLALLGALDTLSDVRVESRCYRGRLPNSSLAGRISVVE